MCLVYQGAYLLGVSEGSLESPELPWKDSYKRARTCLQFKYMLPDATKEAKRSALEVYVGTKEQKSLLWKVRGYHGNRSSKAEISWESKKDFMVILLICFLKNKKLEQKLNNNPQITEMILPEQLLYMEQIRKENSMISVSI